MKRQTSYLSLPVQEAQSAAHHQPDPNTRERGPIPGGGLLLPFPVSFGDRNIAVEWKIREALGRDAG
jgi:hypothetical protein